ncbi:MAG: deoxyribonuclease IV [Lachnospiraceae bacterium]|nr:deoxyribonuclease IV [Lachnospiraceae bacterium]
MLRIGCHLSSSKGFLAMAQTARSIGANTFQFFTRNPRGGAAKEWLQEDVDAMLEFFAANDIAKPLAHAPYTLNACAKEERTREFALETFADDLKRLRMIPGAMYNFHPGSHVQQGAQKGIELIADTLNRVLKEEYTTTVLLETMAGKGSEVGRNFEELRSILDKVELSHKMGVCLDTCHVWDAGYDIVEHLDQVLEQFDRIIGLERLRAIHLNDSMNPLGSHKDRHQKIGLGQIGRAGILGVINHPALRGLPFYLETPNELEGYGEEIAMLKREWTK